MYESVSRSVSTNISDAMALLDTIIDDDIAISPQRIVDKPLVLYGAGNLGRMAKEYLDFLGIPVALVVDTNARRIEQDSFWSEIPMVVPEDAPRKFMQRAMLAVCVVTTPYSPLVRQLAEQGWQDIVPFYDVAEAYRGRHPLENGWYVNGFDGGNRMKIRQIMRGWADATSRAHYLQFIAWRRLRQEWVFANAPINCSDRFLIPEVISALPTEMTFLDAGAHHGEVSRSLMELRPRFQEMLLVEPDSDSFLRINKWCGTLEETVRSRMTVHRCALGAGAGIERFCDGFGYSSKLCPSGEVDVSVKAVDDFDCSASYIKMHLEGGEMQALLGAKKMINACHPIVAMTSYHNELGIVDLPYHLIFETVSCKETYKFYFRLHSWGGVGSVIYAVPQEL
ncbi:MAG: FkbM family methyltransferase [Telmatospirillum sp.]|nr:FkbM family methyltransferase [Telmatospirillum sp.]